MDGGERSTYPAVEAIRTCTKISRTMEEILNRFERGDLRTVESDYHRPRSSRRRPPPTRADREAMREHRLHSDPVKKTGLAKASAKASAKAAPKRRKIAARGKSPAGRKAPRKDGGSAKRAA
jgi:hypothetical protein